MYLANAAFFVPGVPAMATTTVRLTPMSQVVFEFMIKHQRKHQRPPTLKEVYLSLDLPCASSVKFYLAKLMEQGRVKELGPKGTSRRYVAIERAAVFRPPRGVKEPAR
jgi:hypothetical protein